MSKLSKNRKLIISFDSSGEMLILYNKNTNEPEKTSDPMQYNWFRGKSGFNTPIPFWNENNYIWRYR